MKTKHLIAALLIGVVAPLTTFAADEKPAAVEKKAVVKRVDIDEFDKLRADKKNVVLDVRTENEFKAGHIPGAVNIDVNAGDFDEKVGKLDKGKTYLVHCAAGGRSARASRKLEGMGFKELYDLAPGFKGWEKAGKPVEK
jgi:rhodanese-related sulfurtransferase